MEKVIGHYNPNIHRANNPIVMAQIYARVHMNITPSKKGKQEKLERKQKQRGWQE